MSVKILRELIAARKELTVSQFDCVHCLSGLFYKCSINIENYDDEFIESVVDKAMFEIEIELENLNSKNELQLSILTREFSDMYQKWSKRKNNDKY
jgi:hypothetical protein